MKLSFTGRKSLGSPSNGVVSLLARESVVGRR